MNKKSLGNNDVNRKTSRKNKNKLLYSIVVSLIVIAGAFFSKDNMEFITREISMQYFFKGTDNIAVPAMLTFPQC